jgi:hypothetical protein
VLCSGQFFISSRSIAFCSSVTSPLMYTSDTSRASLFFRRSGSPW